MDFETASQYLEQKHDQWALAENDSERNKHYQEYMMTVTRHMLKHLVNIDSNTYGDFDDHL